MAWVTLGKAGKRKANPQTSHTTTEERKGLWFLSSEEGQTDSSKARNDGILADAQGARRAKEEDTDRRILLAELIYPAVCKQANTPYLGTRKVHPRTDGPSGMVAGILPFCSFA